MHACTVAGRGSVAQAPLAITRAAPPCPRPEAGAGGCPSPPPSPPPRRPCCRPCRPHGPTPGEGRKGGGGKGREAWAGRRVQGSRAAANLAARTARGAQGRAWWVGGWEAASGRVRWHRHAQWLQHRNALSQRCHFPVHTCSMVPQQAPPAAAAAAAAAAAHTCSMVSQVSTPKMTGTPLSVEALSTPLVAPPTTAS